MAHTVIEQGEQIWTEGRAMKAVLYRDVSGEEISVDLPLTSMVDVEQLKREIGLPEYVDMSYFPLQRAVVTIWAAKHAHELDKLYPQQVEKRVAKRSISVLLFGGGGFRICCPTSNAIGGPFSRHLKDVDIIVSKRQATDFYRMLLLLGQTCGSRFTHFRTPSDKYFNAMRHGDRYRIRTIDSINADGTPVPGVMDILCDEIDLRHMVDARKALQDPEANVYTIGLEGLILSKCMFIMEVPEAKVDALKESGQEHRILDYSYYRPGAVLIGMEEKDIKDVCAVFLDHEVGEGYSQINPRKIADVLEGDKKFRKTVRLNLENIARNEQYLASLGASAGDISTIVERITATLQYVKQSDERWDKPWWNTDVETPEIT